MILHQNKFKTELKILELHEYILFLILHQNEFKTELKILELHDYILFYNGN